jgi:zinc transporter 7
VDPSTLSVMVAFAVGGLLGDTLFHLLPEIFIGEDDAARARFVLVEPRRNLVLGVGILVGFLTFVAMDKGLRIGTGGAGGHDHSGHAHGKAGEKDPAAAVVASAVDSSDQSGLRRRDGKGAETVGAVSAHDHAGGESSQSVRLGGYLNLMCV